MNVLPQIAPLIADDRVLGLTFGSPDEAMGQRLQSLEQAMAPRTKDRSFASACLAGLWLYHDFFEESHNISQDLHTPEGSYWHAILHRREPDYWNAKYWFRRVGAHPIGDTLRAEALKLDNGGVWPALQHAKKWDAPAFVDLCEQHAAANSAGHEYCRNVQQVEWKLLFEYCHQHAFA